MSKKSQNIINEPSVAYQTPHTSYFQLAERVISKTYIKEVLKLTQIPLNEFIELIPISIDTYKRKSIFNPTVTEKVLQIEEVYQTGIKALGEGFHAWMNAENIMLEGQKPKALLVNSFGMRKLLEIIGRMQHGILS